MAGMLPGVECARRRRIHQGGAGMSSDPPSPADCVWSRRSYFSLYTIGSETHHVAAPKQKHLGGGGGGYRHYVNLGGAAREAKERLDMKLRSQLKSDSGRSRYATNGQSTRHASSGTARNLQMEVFGTRKEGGGGRVGGSFRMLKWGRLNWRSMEHEECAVCLERFRVGENPVNCHVLTGSTPIAWSHGSSPTPIAHAVGGMSLLHHHCKTTLAGLRS